jgi:hypothetical protein
MASWEDDVSLYDEDLAGGVYYDPKSGKYYAEERYKYKGGRKGMFGGRRTKSGYDLIELNEDELADFSSYRDKRGDYARGRRGSKMYSGPGRNVGDVKLGEEMDKYKASRTADMRGPYGANVAGDGMTGMFGAMTAARKAGEDYEKDVAKRVKDYSNWWDKERASGERGTVRRAELKAKAEGTKAMRSRYASGRGWGTV